MIADRHDRRRVLMITQGWLGLLALAVGILAGIGTIRIWMIWLAAGALGLVKCFDLPALQSFVKDLVGRADVANAVAWTSAVSATGRLIGPTFGGLVPITLGAAPGFLINAASFALVVVVLSRMRPTELSPRTPLPRASGQIRETLIYVRNEPALAAIMIILTVVLIAAYNFRFPSR